jgi:N-succinyldiaminopimelate aminotransferase
VALWRDEAHVASNRARYREKFALADRILGDLPGYRPPRAGFFLWLDVGDGERAARALWREAGLRVLPGAYLTRTAPDGSDPGAAYIRVALVASSEEVERGLRAMRALLPVAV